MGTFPIVKRKDEAAHGDYRTKLQILKIYDAMRRAIDTGEPYQTPSRPAPGRPQCGPPCEHPSGLGEGGCVSEPDRVVDFLTVKGQPRILPCALPCTISTHGSSCRFHGHLWHKLQHLQKGESGAVSP